MATYNIRHGAPAGRMVDHRRMVSTVAALGADVVALQEVDRRVVRTWFRDQARAAGTAAGLHPHFAHARPLGVVGSYGNALLLPRSVPFEVHRLRSVSEARVAVIASAPVDGADVTVVCTHLQNRRKGRPFEAPDQLDELLDVLAGRPTPWILMGDLNLDGTHVLPRFERAGLRAVPSGPTYPAHRPSRRIDWIGVRGLEIGRVDVPPLHASDHRPVVAELHLPEGDASALLTSQR